MQILGIDSKEIENPFSPFNYGVLKPDPTANSGIIEILDFDQLTLVQRLQYEGMERGFILGKQAILSHAHEVDIDKMAGMLTAKLAFADCLQDNTYFKAREIIRQYLQEQK